MNILIFVWLENVISYLSLARRQLFNFHVASIGKLYRVVRLHNETAIEPYRIVKVIVSNNFNRKTEECVSTSGSYHVVLTKTRTPSKQEKRKISHDLKTLGISGLYLTNLSGKTTISLVITFTFIVYLSRQSVWCL